MNREKNIILVSHCLLNQNSVVLPLARAKGGYNDLIHVITNQNIGILQLPCPELIHLGLKRPPMSKEDYDTTLYRKLCRELLKPIITQLLYYKDADYNIIGLIGINESPTCGLNNPGILMEELFIMLEDIHMSLDYIAVPTDYVEEEHTEFKNELLNWIVKRAQ